MTAFDRAPFIVIWETTRACALRCMHCAYQPRLAPVPAIAGGAGAVTLEQVTHALASVMDPELGLSIVDLGLVYDVDIRDDHVSITMTLTAPGCPIHDVMPGWVETAVRAVPGVEGVDVRLTFDPPWTPDRIRAAALR